MNILRNVIDLEYDRIRDKIFEETESDPEFAHEQFVRTARTIHKFKLEKLFLDCSENYLNPGFEISNAAGFNKNGDIPPTFLKYLGFDRVVVGTVTGDSWEGNLRPRIVRYPKTFSMVNWMGLPGVGSEEVAKNLESYEGCEIPITINLMSTPEKDGQSLLDDLEKTILTTKNLSFVDKYELNISCPNIHGASKKIDARKEYMSKLDEMLSVVCDLSYYYQEIWEKVSPDQDIEGVREIIKTSRNHNVKGFVIGNTTTIHNPKFIDSPPNSEGKGGASGNGVYERASNVQELFYREIIGQNLDYKIIACGGINSVDRALERTRYGGKVITGIQIFTPLIFEGPKLLRELRRPITS